jgi:hypothetical protein
LMPSSPLHLQQPRKGPQWCGSRRHADVLWQALPGAWMGLKKVAAVRPLLPQGDIVLKA